MLRNRLALCFSRFIFMLGVDQQLETFTRL